MKSAKKTKEKNISVRADFTIYDNNFGKNICLNEYFEKCLRSSNNFKVVAMWDNILKRGNGIFKLVEKISLKFGIHHRQSVSE